MHVLDRKRLLRAISGLSAAETLTAPSASTGAKPHDAAERRQLTVMFCDLVGSTALSARFDQDVIMRKLNGPVLLAPRGRATARAGLLRLRPRACSYR
jgi:class 3 adenylate cyclase